MRRTGVRKGRRRDAASARPVQGSTLRVYPGAPHGITDTHEDELNADLLAFLRE